MPQGHVAGWAAGGQAAVAMAGQDARRVWAGCRGEQGCTKAGRAPVAPEPRSRVSRLSEGQRVGESSGASSSWREA